MKKKVLVDCHPGIRDLLGVLLLHSDENVQITAVTTCFEESENRWSGLTVRDALSQMDAGIVVAEGALGPFIERRPSGGEARHGRLRRSAPPENGYAWDLLYQRAVASKGELTVVALGPLTNIAIALLKYEDLPKHIKRIVIGGGSATHGDVSPFAESNIYQDAYACKVVLRSGVPASMVGLNVATLSCLNERELLSLLGAETIYPKIMEALLAYYRTQSGRKKQILLPDACAASALVAPEVIDRWENFHVEVETESTTMYGRTVVDWRYYLPEPKETPVAMSADRDMMRKMLQKMVASLSRRLE